MAPVSDLVWSVGRLLAPRAVGDARHPGGDGLVHRAVGVGEVDPGRRRGGAPGGGGTPRLPPRRRQHPQRAQRGPRLQSRGPRGERPPGGRGGPALRRCRARRPGRAHQPLRRGPRPGPGPARGRRDPLRRGLRGHAHLGVRPARPQGPLRPGRRQGRSRRSPVSTTPTSRPPRPTWSSATTCPWPRPSSGSWRPWVPRTPRNRTRCESNYHERGVRSWVYRTIPGDDRRADVDFARGVVRCLVVTGHRVAADLADG